MDKKLLVILDNFYLFLSIFYYWVGYSLLGVLPSAKVIESLNFDYTHLAAVFVWVVFCISSNILTREGVHILLEKRRTNIG